MQLRGMPRTILRGSQLHAVELSPKGRTRLQALTVWQRTGQWRVAGEVFRLSRPTLYRWRQRYDPQDLGTLEDHSRRPHRVLTRLRRRGVLVEPPRQKLSTRRRLRPRPYAVRKPKDYVAHQPGELVELDSLDVRPLPGVVFKQFTARDVVSRWDVLEVYTRATATTAARFLDSLQTRLPFPLQALQVDGGSEFAAVFEQECQRRRIPLFVLPPRSPKLNGHVERAQRTHSEEFYECYDGDLELAALRAALRVWEHTYNHIRPHQALGYLTPAEFLADHALRGPSSHMS